MLIYIDFDKSQFTNKQITELTNNFESVIADTSKVENKIPTYASTYEVSSNIYPVEIFVKISREHFVKRINLTQKLKEAIKLWKKENNFNHTINLTVIPMDWELALDI